MESGSRTLKTRTRRSGTKSRNGCGTCKIRRLKCGEEKPICQRCIKFGIECDGYRQKNPHSQPKTNQTILPRTNLPVAVTTSPFASEEEYQYFGLFSSRTSLEILPGIDTGSTRQLLLQSCHLNASIKHAIIAIGALDKKNSVISRFQPISLVSPDCMKNANQHHQTALKQYAKAISHMSTAVSSKKIDLRTTLLISLLIICFEAWSGNMELAVAQVQIGITLILENKARYGGSEQARQSAEGSDLIQIFSRLAVQTTFLGFGLPGPCRALLAAEGKGMVQTMPDIFHSLQEAAVYQQGLVWRGTYFFCIHSAYNPAFERRAVSPEMLSEQARLQADTLKWLQSFGSLESTAPPGCGRQFARLMKSQMTVAYTYGAALLDDETAHDECHAYYTQAVDLVEEFLADEYLVKNNRPADAGFDKRVIMPLWMAGLDCRDEQTRNKAIGLLLRYPRREGMWDSVCTGTILQWVAELEGRFRGTDGYIPGWARIEGLRWTSDFEKRTSVLSCRQRTSNYWAGFAEKTKDISW